MTDFAPHIRIHDETTQCFKCREFCQWSELALIIKMSNGMIASVWCKTCRPIVLAEKGLEEPTKEESKTTKEKN